MPRSLVSRAEPCAVAAAPPTMMKSTRDPTRARRRASKSIIHCAAAGATQFLGESLHCHELPESLLYGELQIFSEQRPVDVLLVLFDDRIDSLRNSRGGHGNRRCMLARPIKWDAVLTSDDKHSIISTS